MKNWKEKYVRWHAARVSLPDFAPSPPVRIEVRFCGRVQKVGFRNEMRLLAERLGITGQVQNHADGSVIAELQGERDRITALIDAMLSLKRARVTDHQHRELTPDPDETGFRIVRSFQRGI